MTQFRAAPTRLVDDAPSNADVLRRANRHFAKDIEEDEAFRRLSERLDSDRRRRTVLSGALALAAAGVAAVLWAPNRPSAEIELTPEALPRTVTRPAVSASPPVVEPERRALLPPAPSARARRVEAPAKPSDDAGVPALPPKAAEAPVPDPSECLRLGREGDRAGAERCFRARAAGNGLSAELALYELSRLRRDVLDDPSGALQALDEHRRRFPGGGLRAEVELTRVELLVRLGRTSEALTEVERLLSSGTGRERDAELIRIRDRLRAGSSATRPNAAQ